MTRRAAAWRSPWTRPSDPSEPVVLLADGRVLRDPTVRELAEAVGLSTHAALPFYDLVIVGAGPAGLAAAVYGSSEGLKTLLIEREAPGGQAGTTSRIENYLGFPSGLTGADLARRALAQARRFGTEIVSSQEAVHHPTRGSVSNGRARRRHRGLLPGGRDRQRGELPAAGRSRRAGACRRRRLLRCCHDRGGPLPRRRGGRHRRWELGGTGRGPPVALRIARPSVRARRRSRVDHERLPDRAGRRAGERRAAYALHRSRAARGRSPRAGRLRDAGRRAGSRAERGVRVHRAAAADRVAGGGGGM